MPLLEERLSLKELHVMARFTTYLYKGNPDAWVRPLSAGIHRFGHNDVGRELNAISAAERTSILLHQRVQSLDNL